MCITPCSKINSENSNKAGDEQEPLVLSLGETYEVKIIPNTPWNIPPSK
jgi:hypothetical protein